MTENKCYLIENSTFLKENINKRFCGIKFNKFMIDEVASIAEKNEKYTASFVFSFGELVLNFSDFGMTLKGHCVDDKNKLSNEFSVSLKEDGQKPRKFLYDVFFHLENALIIKT